MRRLLRHRAGGATGWSRSAWTTLVAAPCVVTLLVALVGPVLAPHRRDAIVGQPYQGASSSGPLLGTDHLGHDVMSLLLYGARGIVVLPLLAVVVGTVIGVPLGILAGLRTTWLSRTIQQITAVLLVLPPLLAVLIVVGTGASTAVVVAVVGALGAVSTIRYLRTATARVATSGYLEYAYSIRESSWSILVREVVPALVDPILADVGLRLVSSVYLVAALSFLNLAPLGGQNWASMVADNADAGGLNTLALLAPGLCIVAFTVSANLLADQLAHRVRG